MPKCPRCGSEIGRLKGQALYQKTWRVDHNNEVEEHPVSEYSEPEFRCPWCSWFITSSMEEAKMFMNFGVLR